MGEILGRGAGVDIGVGQAVRHAGVAFNQRREGTGIAPLRQDY